MLKIFFGVPGEEIVVLLGSNTHHFNQHNSTSNRYDRTNWLSLGGLHNWPNNVLFTQGRFWKYKVALNIQDIWCYNFFNRENSNLMILRHDLISITFGVFGLTGYALGHIQPSYFTRWRRESSRAWSYLLFVSREIEKYRDLVSFNPWT